MEELKEFLDSKFKEYLLGLEVARSTKGISDAMLYNFYQIHVILAANQDKHL